MSERERVHTHEARYNLTCQQSLYLSLFLSLSLSLSREACCRERGEACCRERERET
jgi:hypothetical protein